MSLSKRSHESELLDGANLPSEELWLNMRELEVINRLLSAYSPILSFIKAHKSAFQKNGLRLVDIGCGGGDLLRVIDKYCAENRIAFTGTGIDIEPSIVEFAKAHTPSKRINYVCDDFLLTDYRKYGPDVITCNLFSHHLYGDALLNLYRIMDKESHKGWILTDLERAMVPYHSIKLLTSVFSKSKLVKNDAPLSVAKGFSRNDIKAILSEAGVMADITWVWAFRYQVSRWKGE